MKRINGRMLAFVCLAVLAVTAIAVFGNKQNVQAKKKQNPVEPLEQFVPGRILVKFHNDVIPAHARNIIAALSARDADEIPNIEVHILELPDQASEKAFVSAFQARSEVEFAELDRILQPADVTPNDPWYGSWEWYLTKISAPTAWSTSTGNGSIIIAIIDSGIDGNHEDLASNLVSGWNIYDNNSNTSDVVGHGTSVAGAAAATSNNQTGVASICWNCRIMPIRVTDTTGYLTYSNAAKGINWAADHGARVANISAEVSDSSTVKTAAQYFQSKSGVVTCSAGNEATFDSAADNPYILTVSATDGDDALTGYSNSGNNVDLSAPGTAYTTYKGGTYGNASGTSISAPVVAGVAALVLSVNPGLTPSQVQDILKESADDLGSAGWDPSYGWGRVNAARAVSIAGGASPTPAPTPSPTPTPTPTPTPDTTAPSVSITSPSAGAAVSTNVSVLVTAADDVAVTKVELYVDGKLTASSTSAPFTTKWNSRKASAGAHTLQCTAYDAAANAGSSASVTVYR